MYDLNRLTSDDYSDMRKAAREIFHCYPGVFEGPGTNSRIVANGLLVGHEIAYEIMAPYVYIAKIEELPSSSIPDRINSFDLGIKYELGFTHKGMVKDIGRYVAAVKTEVVNKGTGYALYFFVHHSLYKPTETPPFTKI